jgi:hypothetical protein
MITADQLVAHAVGDYILQSDWMATEKTKQNAAAAAHAFTYTLPFLFLTTSPEALAVILVTHFAIDRWRLARYVVWLKNRMGPNDDPWEECKATGFHESRPAWLTVWLLIITDNVMHVLINGLALRFL